MFVLGVFSDSHGRGRQLQEGMKKAVQDHGVKGFLYLGDGVGDFLHQQKAFPGMLYWQVQGNCDFFHPNVGVDKMFTLENQQIYGAHGHRYGVKQGTGEILAAARERNCQVACFGHTHVPFINEEEGVLLFNPGSIGAIGQPTFGVLKISKENISPYIETM